MISIVRNWPYEFKGDKQFRVIMALPFMASSNKITRNYEIVKIVYVG
jgi:hypothetical protein